jgi:hypothetical protein
VIRLTVLYNLPAGTDEEEFLAWRLGEHQASNAAMPGVRYTDFARVVEGWPPGAPTPHRFMTTADWPDWESFQAAFYSPGAQAKLHEDVKRISDFVFYISEILVAEGSIAAAASS